MSARLICLSIMLVFLCLATPMLVSADAPTSDHFVYMPLLLSPAPPRSSEELIDAAVGRGEIDDETALIYKVFAAFGDDRLPERYRGDDSQVEDSDVLQVVAEQFDSLSPHTQATLQPFLVRPTAPESWLEQALTGFTPTSSPAIPGVIWGKIDTANGKIKVWYQRRYAGDWSKAEDVALALDAIIWPALIDELKMKEPLSDSLQPDNGGDGRLDIYLVHIGDRGIARAMAGCEETPVYILINSDRPIGSATQKGMLQTVVHELMHASQFAYPVKAACSEYAWWAEASAKWAEDYVYPLANSEQPYVPPFLSTPEWSLEDDRDKKRPYGAYLWPFYLTHKHRAPALVRTIWEHTKDADSLEAIDRSIPGGFESEWPEFTAYDWNRPPLDDYQKWDKLEARITSYPIGVYPEASGDARIPLPLPAGVEHLAAEYFHFTFPDDAVRTVALYNGYSYKVAEQDVDQLLGGEPRNYLGVQFTAETLSPEEREGAHVKALVKISGQDWRVEDWTDKPIAVFCRDKADERVEELVLIFSNSLFEPRDDTSVRRPKGLAPTLWVSDIGCWRWEGRAQWNFHDVLPPPP